MPSKKVRWTEPLISIGQTVCGFVLALAPVTLWVAWSPFVLLVVVAAIGVSTGIFVLLHGCEHSATEDRLATPWRRPGAFLPDEFIEELHQISPLTYHHSLKPRARFRRAMEKLRRPAQ